MNINILDLQRKYSMENPGNHSGLNTVSLGMAESGEEMVGLIQGLYDKLLPLIEGSVKSVLVTNCGAQQQAASTDFYVARITRELFVYKEVENEVASKSVTIDFQKKLATKNGKPFLVENFRLFTKIIFKKLSKDIHDKQADVLEEFYDDDEDSAVK